MKTLTLSLFLLLQTAAILPALAQEGCPNTCPEGQIRSVETGECEVIRPMV